MKAKNWLALACLAWLLASAGTVHAEVVCEGGCGRCLQITEDPDPMYEDPQFWEVFRTDAAPWALNPDGDDNGDGEPSITADPITGCPVAVWAFNAGPDFEIAFSRWDGTRWSETEFLSVSAADDIDPQAFIDPEGNIYVTWWQPGEDVVLLSVLRVDGGLWTGPEFVVAGGRRPSIAVLDGQILIAYEVDAVAGGQQVAVHYGLPGQGVVEKVVDTERMEQLDVRLHAENGRLWMDWKESEALFGFTEWSDGAWALPPATIEWTDPSWIGQQETRRVIRSQLFAP
jgi:hypothetical protein